MVKEEISAGKLLLAEPFMQDVTFQRAVVLLCEHNDLGSMGFILNKELDVKIASLISGFPDFSAKVYYGGPVQTNTIHYIHDKGDILDDSILIMDGVYWGGDFEKLKFLIASELIKPQNIRFFVGYSGWSEGQLLEEISYGSWIVTDMDTNYVLGRNSYHSDHLWEWILKGMGNVYSVISQLPDKISWN